MTLNELLELRGLDLSKRIKILRHLDTRKHDSGRIDCHKLSRDGWLLTYESIQNIDILNCDFTVATLGLERNRSVFVGVRKVIKRGIKRPPEEIPDYFPNKQHWTGNPNCKEVFLYELESVSGFEDLENRVVIDWKSPGTSWHQYMEKDPKEIVQIWPKGYVQEFPGFLNISLEFHELEKIIKQPEANIIWHTMLRSMSGVYLLLDTVSGRQYVGSAYGADGLLGRWKTYVNNGHGGNKMLIDLLVGEPKRQKDFLFSVLHILPNSVPKNEVIGWERTFKNKLGSRAFGLNSN